MERRAANDESDDLKTLGEPRKKRLVRQPAKNTLPMPLSLEIAKGFILHHPTRIQELLFLFLELF